MKVEVLKRFHDRKENVIREVGDVFEVDEKRFTQIETGLAKFGKGDWVKEVVEKVPVKEAPAKAPAKGK